MLNPYEPPNPDVRYLSLAKRLQRGIGRAWREYRQGLVREKFTHMQHIHAWVTLFFAGNFILAAIIWWGVLVLWMLGIVQL